MKNANWCVVVSIGQEKRREGLFKHFDDARNRTQVLERTATKRVLTLPLFNRLQSKIDAYPAARVSLVEKIRPKEYEVIVADTKPMSDAYNELLRRIRF